MTRSEDSTSGPGTSPRRRGRVRPSGSAIRTAAMRRHDAATLAQLARRARGPLVEAAPDGAEVTFVVVGPAGRREVWVPALGRPGPLPLRQVGVDADGQPVHACGLLLPAAGPFSYVHLCDRPRASLVFALAAVSARARAALVRELLASARPDPFNPQVAPAPYGGEGAPGACDRRVPHLVNVVDHGPDPAHAPSARWTPSPAPGRRVRLPAGPATDGREIDLVALGSAPSPGRRPVVVVLDGEVFAWLTADLHRWCVRADLPGLVVAFVHNRVGGDRQHDLTRPHLLDPVVDTVLAAARDLDEVDHDVDHDVDRAPGHDPGGPRPGPGAGRAAPGADAVRPTLVLVGASLGGLAVSALASRREDVHAVVALSGSFWWPGAASRPVPAAVRRLVLTLGRLETEPARGWRLAFGRAVRRHGERTRACGVPVQVVTAPGGHDLPGWRGPLLQALLGDDGVLVDPS